MLCGRAALASEQTDAGKDKIDGFKSALPESAVVATEFFDPTTTDFRPLISKLKGQNPDCLFVEVRSNSAATFFKQLQELQFTPNVFSNSYSVTPGLIPALSSEQASRLWFSSTTVHADTAPGKQFFTGYEAAHQKKPTDFSAMGYDMVKLIYAAAKSCLEVTTVCIEQRLHKPYQGVLGNLQATANREFRLEDYTIYKISDGTFVSAK